MPSSICVQSYSVTREPTRANGLSQTAVMLPNRRLGARSKAVEAARGRHAPEVRVPQGGYCPLMVEKSVLTWKTRGAWFDQHPLIQFVTLPTAFFVFRLAANRWLFSEDEGVLHSLLLSVFLSGVVTLLGGARFRHSQRRRAS